MRQQDEEAFLQAQASQQSKGSDIPKIATVGGPSTHNPSNFLHAKKKIGSVGNGQINFAKDQTFFTGSDEERFNRNVTHKVHAIKDLIDKDILATKKPEWDNSIGVVGHERPEPHAKTLFEIKKGLKDERVQKTKPQKVYAGTDTRDAHYTGWNVSHETVHHRDSERFLAAT